MELLGKKNWRGVSAESGIGEAANMDCPLINTDMFGVFAYYLAEYTIVGCVWIDPSQRFGLMNQWLLGNYSKKKIFGSVAWCFVGILLTFVDK